MYLRIETSDYFIKMQHKKNRSQFRSLFSAYFIECPQGVQFFFYIPCFANDLFLPFLSR